jgi:hypothetical protein
MPPIVLGAPLAAAQRLASLSGIAPIAGVQRVAESATMLLFRPQAPQSSPAVVPHGFVVH